MTDEILVKGPVLGPGWIGRPAYGLTDRPLTEKEIQKAAYQFLPGTPIIDVDHDMKKQAEVVESFITSDYYHFNGEVYNPGTWFLTSRVTDPELIREIRSGKFTGYSVGAFPEEYRDRLVAKGLFADVKEGEWFAVAVSIAQVPFYPQAIFKVFEPDEFIKKNIPDMEVDNLKEENNALASFTNKLLDLLIKKEVKSAEVKEIAEGPKFVTEEMLDQKLEAHYARISELLSDSKEKQTEEESKESKEEKKESKDTKEEKEPEKESKETKESEESKESKKEAKESKEDPEKSEDETMISKAINIDEVKKEKTGNKTFFERAGCDSLGRNPKYL